MKLIGIFGGTFNPIHLGHMHVANEVLAHIPMDELRFLPCYQPVHRSDTQTSAEHRAAMLAIAIANHAKMRVDTHEIDRKGPSYMIDTLVDLKREYPEDRLALILGFDAFVGLPHWKSWERLADYCHFIVVNRPDSPKITGQLAQFAQQRYCFDSNDLLTNTSGRIYSLIIPPCDISATHLREVLEQGGDAKNMLPEGIMAYIRDNNLYYP